MLVNTIVLQVVIYIKLILANFDYNIELFLYSV